ncbi:MAG: phage/plasmid primase, P4 family [Lentisphaeria bacterium]|nr:phage/plasmid primase, P4 family [Lentisphaeria bacterium]
MLEVNKDIFSIKNIYNTKDNTIMDNDIKPIKDEQMEFDFGTKRNINNVENDIDENVFSENAEPITPLFSAVLNADPELASDAKRKMDAENKKRINTLRENGAKGGRPPIDRGGLAKMCLDAVFTKHGQCLLRHYKGDWYLYMRGCYSQIPEEEIDKKLTGYLLRSGAEVVSSAIRRDVLGNLKSDALCGLTVDKYAKPCIISTGESAFGFVSMKNGIINIDEIANALENGLTPPAVRPHTPDLFTTVRLPYEYNPTATCPKFEAYLEGVQPKAENREILQMLAGLLLTSDMRYNVAFFIYGQGGTGKSVFMDTLQNMLGPEMICCVPLACFADRFNTMPLTVKKANIVDEAPIIPDNEHFADIESVFKSVTSGNKIKVERKCHDAEEARATARCVFASNTLPTMTDKTNGVWDRIRIIPFDQVFRNTDKQNPNLTEELKEELPGILNWALRGYAKLCERTASSAIKTFPQCEEGSVALQKLREDSDHERAFLREATEASLDPEKYLETHRLYLSYKSWALECGYRPVAECNFVKAVKRVYPTAIIDRKRVGTSRPTVAYGIAWFTDRPEPPSVTIPIVPYVQCEQGSTSNEWDSQPDLGF